MAVTWKKVTVNTKAGKNTGKLVVRLPKSGLLRGREITVPVDDFTSEQVAKARVLEAISVALRDWHAQMRAELDKQAPSTLR